MDDKKGFVYVIQDVSSVGNLYKIGRTKNLKQRLRNLQVGNAGLMRAIYYLPVSDAVKAERMLHNIFAADKVKGEWYQVKDTAFLKDIFSKDSDHEEQYERMGLR